MLCPYYAKWLLNEQGTFQVITKWLAMHGLKWTMHIYNYTVCLSFHPIVLEQTPCHTDHAYGIHAPKLHGQEVHCTHCVLSRKWRKLVDKYWVLPYWSIFTIFIASRNCSEIRTTIDDVTIDQLLYLCGRRSPGPNYEGRQWIRDDVWHRRRSHGCRGCSCTPNIQPLQWVQTMYYAPQYSANKSCYVAVHKHKSHLSNLVFGYSYVLCWKVTGQDKL